MFETKDSGKREDFSTGSVRDTQEGKPRQDLISPFALKRWGHLMARGAEKYGERNWEKGQPFSRLSGSGLRHLLQFMEGDTSEDHLAAVLFNIGAIIHFQELGRDELNDMPVFLHCTEIKKGTPEEVVMNTYKFFDKELGK